MAVNPTLMNFHPERRLNAIRPRDHQRVHQRRENPSQNNSRIRQALFPQSRTHVSRVTAPTHHYLTQTRAPASATRLDTVATGPNGCCSRRPASPGLDHERAEETRRSRRRARRGASVGNNNENRAHDERVVRVYQQRQAVSAAVFDGVARHSWPERRSAASGSSASCEAARRRGTGCTAHEPMQRLVLRDANALSGQH